MQNEFSHVTVPTHEMSLPWWDPGFLVDDLFGSDLDEQEPLTNILLVEDDQATSRLLKAMMTASDDQTRIKSVYSAEEAERHLKFLKDNHIPGPEIAVVDFSLSGEKNGVDVCRLIEKYFPTTRITLISGHDLDEISRQLESTSAEVNFLPKPLNRNQVREIIQKY